MKYTTLLLDADETLLDFCRSEGFALEATLAAHGIAMTPAMQNAYHEINRLLWQQLERGEILRERLKVQRFEELFESIGAVDIDAADFNEQYMQTLGTRGFLLEGALELVQTLSKRYRLCIVTNGTASVQHTRLADSGLLPYMEHVFISQEIGADKPSPVFFDAVLSALGHPDKAELLIIGDSLTSDIRGGILSGIDTCWFDPAKKQAPAELTLTYHVSNYQELCDLLA